MSKRDRDLKRLLTIIADRANARLQIRRTGSGHQKATFLKAAGTSFNVIAPSTPSDHRSIKNMIAFTRRQLRA